MEPVEIYSKCKESVCNVKALFNYYEKYNSCISVSYLEEKKNDILRRVAHSYAMLMVKVDNAPAINNLVLINDDEELEAIAGEYPLFIDHVIDRLEKYEDHIINMLQSATEQKKITYLYDFDSSYKDADKLVNKMEGMIRNSQTINQSYLRATA